MHVFRLVFFRTCPLCVEAHMCVSSVGRSQVGAVQPVTRQVCCRACLLVFEQRLWWASNSVAVSALLMHVAGHGTGAETQHLRGALRTTALCRCTKRSQDARNCCAVTGCCFRWCLGSNGSAVGVSGMWQEFGSSLFFYMLDSYVSISSDQLYDQTAANTDGATHSAAQSCTARYHCTSTSTVCCLLEWVGFLVSSGGVWCVPNWRAFLCSVTVHQTRQLCTSAHVGDVVVPIELLCMFAFI
jgi:hypothetical protein